MIASKTKNPITTPSNIAKNGQRSFIIPLTFDVTSLKAVVGSVTIIIVPASGPPLYEPGPFAFSA